MRVPSQRIPQVALLDGLLLCALAGFLVSLHYLLGDAIHARFVFTYGEPKLVTVWTAALLHDSTAHLSSNLAWYAIVIVTTYVLYLDWGQRRTFWVIFGVLMVATPPITTGLDYWLLYQRWGLAAETATAQGFSGVISAFGGMLFVTLGIVIGDRVGIKMGLKTLLIVAFGSVVGVATATESLTSRVILLLFIGGVALLAIFVSWNELRHPMQLWSRLTNHLAEVEVAGPCGVVFIILVIALFPVEGISDERFVNLIAHGTGLTTGICISSMVTIRLFY